MWDEEFAVAQEAALKAGQILADLFGKVNRITKKGAIDLVTEADVRAEDAILKVVRDHFPEDGILAEESGRCGEDADRIWIVDPLDGTTNFAHGFPFFAVSIALQVDGDVVLGLVFNPLLNESFAARRGGGAYLNRSPIRVSENRGLRESLLATGFPYSICEGAESVMDLLSRMVVLAQGVRRAGSAAIDLCYVAAGRFDGFWEEGLKPWDTAAGSLIVREAGGMVSDYSGAPYSPGGRSIVAANPHIHGAMLRVLAP